MKQFFTFLLLMLLAACTTTEQQVSRSSDSVKIPASYLEQQSASTEAFPNKTPLQDDLTSAKNKLYQRIPSLADGPAVNFTQNLLSNAFNTQETLQVSANELPMKDFLHYVLGQLLKVNYVLDDALKAETAPVTMVINEAISARRLFDLTSQLLAERGAQIIANEGVYFVRKQSDSSSDVVVAIGAAKDSVPSTPRKIMQIVPLRYGINLSLERTLRDLLKIQIVPDFDQNLLFITGSRSEILQALEFVQLFDQPAMKGRYIGLIRLTYIGVDDFSQQLTDLMGAEGVPIQGSNGAGKNVVLLPLKQLGAVAVFSTSDELLARVKFWAQLIDKPSDEVSKRYFTYKPQFARATDIGESLSMLLGQQGGMSGSVTPQTSSPRESTGSQPSQSRSMGVANDTMRMVVDELSNSIVFYTTGNEYQNILPLLSDLDVMPKQVMLDITIAEVTLKDEFKYGVEWALQNGEVTMSTQGAFGASGIGGLSVLLDGSRGPATANFLATSSLVNVLSKPSLLVRDGKTANINIGSDISVVGATTSDPLTGQRQTTTTEYRKTGVDITVTPTVNSEGIVILEISQTISNSLPSSGGASGNPDIFERSLQTEVLATSGATVMLGGLISEDASTGDSKAPGVSKIPGLGWLFKSSGDSKSRTELVMLITPTVLNSQTDTQNVKQLFMDTLKYLVD